MDDFESLANPLEGHANIRQFVSYNFTCENLSRFKVRCLDRAVHCDWSN